MSPRKQERVFEPKYASELLRIAEGDLDTARALQGAAKYRIENAFYMVQQAIEKSLKAVLVASQTPVPQVHDLGVLVAKLPQVCEPPYGYELLDLNEYANLRRYQEGTWQPNQEELAQVITVGENMLSWATATVRRLLAAGP